MGAEHEKTGDTSSREADSSSVAASDVEGQIVAHVEGLQSGLKSRHAQMIALGKD